MLARLVDDYLTQKQNMLLQLKKGVVTKEEFLKDVRDHIRTRYAPPPDEEEDALREFERYVFGYSRLSPLIDDREISDIRVIRHDRIRVKRKGKREDAGISFDNEKEYRQFIDYIAIRNQVSVSNLNAIQRFTDADSHQDFILRFTISMPLINSYDEPYLCIRKVPKRFPQMSDLVEMGMMNTERAQLLVERFGKTSTLICGGNSSGKTTLLNALKETLPDDMAVLVAQQADELTTLSHPDTMFLHSLPGSGESKVSYDLKDISIAGLTMDVDFFIVGEIKGAEALYILNSACTGQICAATIHSTDPLRAADKLVDYAMYESRYSRNELMRLMDCFGTIVYMKDYKVCDCYACKGWNEERGQQEYERLF